MGKVFLKRSLLFFSLLLAHNSYNVQHKQKLPEQELVDVSIINPNISIKLFLATSNNMLGKKLYSENKCYLRREVAYALSRAQHDFEALGYSLEVRDGFRPMLVQWELWNWYPDSRYVADPRKGGMHTRGTAVDVGLVDAQGNTVNMSTSDAYSQEDHADYTDLPADILFHRKLLQKIMTRHGFEIYKYEWWHFNYRGWELCPPLDIAFEDLGK